MDSLHTDLARISVYIGHLQQYRCPIGQIALNLAVQRIGDRRLSKLVYNRPHSSQFRFHGRCGELGICFQFIAVQFPVAHLTGSGFLPCRCSGECVALVQLPVVIAAFHILDALAPELRLRFLILKGQVKLIGGITVKLGAVRIFRDKAIIGILVGKSRNTPGIRVGKGEQAVFLELRVGKISFFKEILCIPHCRTVIKSNCRMLHFRDRLRNLNSKWRILHSRFDLGAFQTKGCISDEFQIGGQLKHGIRVAARYADILQF